MTDKHDQNGLADDSNKRTRELNSLRSKATLNFTRRSYSIPPFNPILELEETPIDDDVTPSYVGKNEDSMYFDSIGPSQETI